MPTLAYRPRLEVLRDFLATAPGIRLIKSELAPTEDLGDQEFAEIAADAGISVPAAMRAFYNEVGSLHFEWASIDESRVWGEIAIPEPFELAGRFTIFETMYGTDSENHALVEHDRDFLPNFRHFTFRDQAHALGLRVGSDDEAPTMWWRFPLDRIAVNVPLTLDFGGYLERAIAEAGAAFFVQEHVDLSALDEPTRRAVTTQYASDLRRTRAFLAERARPA